MLPDVEVTMFWKDTVLAVEQLEASGVFTIGTDCEATLCVNNKLLPDKYTFLTRAREQVILHFAGWMKVNNKKNEVISYDYILTEGDEVVVLVGDLKFKINLLQKVIPFAFTPAVKTDNNFLKFLLATAIVQIVLLVGMKWTNVTIEKKEESFKKVANFHEIVIKNQLNHKPHISKKPADVLEEKKLAPKSVDNHLVARNMLHRLGLSEKSKESKTFIGGVGAGVNKSLGKLSVPTNNVDTNQLGTGIRGVNPGGSVNTVGIGKMGEGSLVGNNAELGVGESGVSRGETNIEPGHLIYEGSLTKEEIQHVVEKFMAQIKYCYDREFQKYPDLSGKLLAQWVIAAEGNVNTSKMTQNSMGNINVEKCVLRVINRMTFPKPRGGGIVKVNYPFLFSSAGA